MTAKAITFAHVKGGVGKTTLIANLASLASSKGLTVVVVDMDVTSSFSSGVFGDYSENNVTAALHRIRNGEMIDDLIEYSEELGVWCLRSDVKRLYNSNPDDIDLIPDMIHELKSSYVYDTEGEMHAVDIVFIDSPGGSPEILLANMISVEMVAIPLLLADWDQNSLPLITALLKTARKNRQSFDGQNYPVLLGMIPNKVGNANPVERAILESMPEKDWLLPFIPESNYLRSTTIRGNSDDKFGIVHVAPESFLVHQQFLKLWEAIQHPESIDRKQVYHEVAIRVGLITEEEANTNG